MSKWDLIKSLSLFLVIFLTVVNKMPDFLGKKRSITKEKVFDDAITQIGGKVLHVRQADNRTYLQVLSPRGDEFWITCREINASPGDQLSFELCVPRQDYYSEEMQRNFSEIYVVPYLKLTRVDSATIS